MTYWRTSRAMSGAQPSPGSPHRDVTVRELKSLPPLPSGAIFKPFNLQEPPSDKFSARDDWLISFVAGFVFVTSAVLLFVEF